MTTKNGQRIPAQRRIDAAARQSKHLHPDGPLGVQEVPEMFVRGLRRPLCFAVEGDCLAPLGIVDGDSVLVDQANTTPQHGEIIACKLNGTLLLKAYLWPVVSFSTGFYGRPVSRDGSSTWLPATAWLLRVVARRRCWMAAAPSAVPLSQGRGNSVRYWGS